MNKKITPLDNPNGNSPTVEWVILSYGVGDYGTISVITSKSPEGGTRMMGYGDVPKAREAYRLLQMHTEEALYEASCLADAFYFKKGNLVLLFGTDMRANHEVGIKRNKRLARAHAPSTWANLPIPEIKFIPLTKGNDGHGWVSKEYLDRVGVSAPRGRKHFSFVYQHGNTQYKGACVIARLPKGVDMVIPNDGKDGVLCETPFFSLTMGFSHVNPRIDVQWLCNTIAWVDYSDVIHAQAKTITSSIRHANVPGRGEELNSYVKAGVLPALTEEYRKQEVNHLLGTVKGGFRIPAVTGLIAFSSNVPTGHVKIDRLNGLIVVNPIDYLIFMVILGGMDGDDHVIVIFTGEDEVLLYRQPNQVGECVKMKVWGSVRSDHTELPAAKIVGSIPTPKVEDLIQYPTPSPTGGAFNDFCRELKRQEESAKYVGSVANISMLTAVSGQPPVGGMFPDFESMIKLELVEGDTSRLDWWIKVNKGAMRHYMGGCTTLPVSLQRKAGVEGPTPYLGDVVHANLKALEGAVEMITSVKAGRIGYEGVLCYAMQVAPSLPAISWVKEFGKLAMEGELGKFPEFLEAHIKRVGTARFESEVVVALARAWFVDGNSYVLLQKVVFDVVVRILNAFGVNEDPATPAKMFNMNNPSLIGDEVFVYRGGMYTAQGLFVGVCMVEDGQYNTATRNYHAEGKKYRWQFAKRIKPLTSYRIRKIVSASLGVPAVLLAA